jgi:transcriptional regulator with XRE-family HTH domain
MDAIVTKHEAERFLELVRHLTEHERSQARAAQRLGLSPAYVSKIVRGVAGTQVRRATLDLVCKSLNVDERFFREDGPVDAWFEYSRVLPNDPASPTVADYEGAYRSFYDNWTVKAVRDALTESADVGALMVLAGIVLHDPRVYVARELQKLGLDADPARARPLGRMLAEAMLAQSPELAARVRSGS